MLHRIIKITTLGLWLFAASSAHGQQSRWATKDDPTAKNMIDMERQWAESACARNGIEEKIMADDFQGTSPEGKRYTKADEIKTNSTPRDSHDCRLDDAKVHFFGNSVALVYGSERRVVKAKDGSENNRCLIWTDTWLKREGKWQVVAAQDTKVECK
jgi:hypothetical protein